MRRWTALLLIGLLVVAARAQDGEASAPEQEAAPVEQQAPEAPSEPAPAPAPAKPAGVLGVGPISAVVYSSDGKKASSSSGQLGEALFKAAKLGSSQSIEVSFTPTLDGAPARPQQAMLLASSSGAPDLAAYAIAKVKKDGTHSLTLSTAGIEKQVANAGGELDLTLLLGDPAAPLGLRGSLGSIVLPEAASAAPPKPRLLSARQQPVSNIKPNIAHTFRPPAKRPPAVVSVAFAGLAVLPLLALLAYLAYLGVNLRGLPSGASALWVLLFHLGIGGLLGLYLVFWLGLNLAQTIPPALALGLFTAATGYKALSALSDERLATEGKAGAAVGAKKTN